MSLPRILRSSSSEAVSSSWPSKRIEPVMCALGARHRLAGARLADDPERLPGVDGVGDAVDGLHEAVLRLEVDLEVGDLEQCHQYLTLGSM
jgi:hypothetical protein